MRESRSPPTLQRVPLRAIQVAWRGISFLLFIGIGYACFQFSASAEDKTEVRVVDKKMKNAQWTDTTRQLVMDFLENYKTAYCLKEFEYISSIFDENATIVVGSVAKRTTQPGIPESRLRSFTEEEVTYRRYNKQQYLESLKRTFERNQLVNIKFTQNDVMKLEKELPRQVFQIQIGQEYNSSTYADQGYLFLLVDMTDKSQPLIRIRGWQPKPDPEFGLFTAGYFLK